MISALTPAPNVVLKPVLAISPYAQEVIQIGHLDHPHNTKVCYFQTETILQFIINTYIYSQIKVDKLRLMFTYSFLI